MQKVDQIIQQLKDIDVDGETMQYILEQVGMDDQMHRQLIMTKPTESTTELLEERIGNARSREPWLTNGNNDFDQGPPTGWI